MNCHVFLMFFSVNVVKKSRVLVNPGKSMVEWMKFQQDQSTGSAVKLRKIGLDEIALHNKPGDVWMALNGISIKKW
jgi:hypothetical protein